MVCLSLVPRPSEREGEGERPGTHCMHVHHFFRIFYRKSVCKSIQTVSRCNWISKIWKMMALAHSVSTMPSFPLPLGRDGLGMRLGVSVMRIHIHLTCDASSYAVSLVINFSLSTYIVCLDTLSINNLCFGCCCRSTYCYLKHDSYLVTAGLNHSLLELNVLLNTSACMWT